MITKSAALALLLLGSVSAVADMLVLTFSDRPVTTAKVYGTQKRGALPTISTQSGQTVVVQKQRGRDFQLQAMPASWSRVGTQVQQVPRDAINLTITPTVEGNQVTLVVEYLRKDSDDTLSYTGTISGATGEWIPLLQPQGAESGGKSWSAGSAADQLSVRVERR